MGFKLKYSAEHSSMSMLTNHDELSNEVDFIHNNDSENDANVTKKKRSIKRNRFKPHDDDDNNGLKYSTRYRVLKTCLLIFAFISYGVNFEIVGPTLEDLRVQMNVNYTRISFGLL